MFERDSCFFFPARHWYLVVLKLGRMKNVLEGINCHSNLNELDYIDLKKIISIKFDLII